MTPLKLALQKVLGIKGQNLILFFFFSGGINYWGIFAFEILVAYYIWSVTCGVDMSMGFYALHYVNEVKILTSRLRTLLSSDHYRRDLKLLVDRHCELLKFHHVLEDIYGLIVLWLVISGAVNLCLASYQISRVSINFFFTFNRSVMYRMTSIEYLPFFI